MPSSVEIRIEQKRKLFQLMQLKKSISDSNELDNLIISIEAEMEEEDVAWVEKKIAQLK